ncbi:presenilin family intramembrane aspartyl protease [Halobacteria archaeon AArc-m2/3/4]|uniref:Presenilin family intramembrane aspartyl protease n=1 Tax=Natronoglomus mannanivorans TaxID=2979990 RepID=A0AAP2Z1H2_9EURY|nr:presenilin family intramembrane aspartyl protease [Halobacteria archaeon AArc-xg1-1]MCU4972982.1 presenilin family intramembrane aspartyl protease [Halobacteria archaeon AArc-m2/3/4]
MSENPGSPTVDGANERDSDVDSTGTALDLESVLPYLGIAVCYLLTILGGLALADEAASMGLLLFENPDSVGNVGVFAALVVGFTIVFVAAVRYDRGMDLIRLFLVIAFGGLVAAAVVLATGFGSVFVENPMLAGLPSSPLSVGITLGVALILWVYPEWYVLDIVAVVAGAAAIAMLGISFGPLPIVVLLVVWAAYDAYSVYVTGHMKDVAAGAGSMKVPMVFVVPTARGYSLRESGLDLGLEDDGGNESENGTDEGALETEAEDSSGVSDSDSADANAPEADVTSETDTPEASDETTPARSEQPAMILGLGDALIPGMLAVSAGHFLEGAPTIVPTLNANAPALGALAGGVVGLGALVVVLHRFEGAHAGLPPLNAGVLGGYLLGAVVAGVPLTTAIGL